METGFGAITEWTRTRIVVREEGLEPSHPYGHRHLKPARLPIPPLAQVEGPD